MKLRALDIEHFGVFSGQTLEFDSRFSLVFGPNEAGKSTLLQLIRELLFGFRPLQNPYVFHDHAGEMAATARFDVSNGTTLRFRRRKGKKNEVVGQIDPTGRKVDAAALNGMLGGASKEVYDQVFGFSLRELAEADESLKRANLTEALYGGGLGGLAHFQRIQAELQSEADVLFTSRGRSKQLIHKLLSNIKDQSKELKAQTVKPRDFEQLTREAKEAHATVELLRQQLESMRARKAHLDRLADAIGPWLRSRDAERELAELQIPDDFPIDGGEQFTRLKVRRTELAEELEGVERELAEESEQLAALQLAPDLLANEAVIRELEQQITQVVGYRRDLPLRQQDSNSIKSRVRAQLKSFSPDWDDRHLERFRTTLAQRETVDRLEAELEELLRRKSTAAAERRTVENDLRTLQEQLSSSDTDDLVDSLTSILELAPEYQQQVERLGEVRQQSSTIENDIEVFLLKLSSPLGTKIKVDDMSPLPMSATVAEFRERLDRSGHDVTEAERSVLAIRQDCDQKQEQLALCDASTAVPDRDQLRASRENRDEGWRLIREQFLDQKAPSDVAVARWLQLDKVSDVEIAKSLASSYEASVRAADDLADERQDKAEEAATRDQLKYEIGRLEKRLTAAEQNLELHLQQHQQVLNQWESLWSECLFAPLSPSAMFDWLKVYDEFTGARTKLKQLQDRARSLESKVSEFERQLSTVFPGASDSPAQRIARARQRHEAVRDAKVRRRTYEEQLRQKEQTLRSLDDQLVACEAELRDWQIRWETLMGEFEFPRDWDVHLASKILGGLVEARSEWDKAFDLDRRIADMSDGISSFTTDVSELCQRIAPMLADFAPEVAMKELQAQLDAAKIAHRDDERLQRSCAKLRKHRDAKGEQLVRIDAELDQLLGVVGTKSEAEFQRVALAAKRRAELTLTHRAATGQISALRGTEDELAFCQELENADADSIAIEQQRLGHELKKVESDFDVAFKKSALLDEKRLRLDGTSHAADLALELESTRSQLATAVDRWAPLVLAQALMKQALMKFEREQQPVMLVKVEQLFQKMTLGRYQSIERKLDEHGTLLVVDDGGKRKEPHQLSTGTREQLYLAIRLAYIDHYCLSAEPLPIVMDDVLVNFDGERARQTLRAFEEVADKVQIIFLTCHQHTIEMARDVFPSTQPIVLSGGKLTEGSVTTMRAAKRNPGAAVR